MKKLLTLLVMTACTLLSAHAQKKVPVITLEGTPYQMGYQHGQLLKSQIAEVFGKWKASLEKDTGKEADQVIKDFLENTQFHAAIQKWTPEIYEEVKGIADGSGQKLDDVFAFNLIDEYWAYLDRLEHPTDEKNKCTAVGVAKTRTQPTVIAQNVDIDSYMNGYQVLLHLKGNKTVPEQYIMTCAGFLGFAGMNQNLSLVINAITEVNTSTDGLPVTFVTRGILLKKNEKEARAFIEKVNHATGQSYMVGTENKVFLYEASANQVIAFNPHNHQLVYHTNHSIVNEDIKPWRVESRNRMLSGTGRKNNSHTRLASVNNFLEKYEHKLTADNIKDILRSKEDPIFPICVSYREGGASFTFSSVVFTLGKNPSAEVTFGEPDKNEYQKHYFKP